MSLLMKGGNRLSVFSIRIKASASRYYHSPTGDCVPAFSLDINLSVRQKI